MKPLFAIIIFCFALFSGRAAGAQQLENHTEKDTGSSLFHACQSSVRAMDGVHADPSDSSFDLYCAGYFEGFSDVVTLNESSLCIKNARIGTLIRVYIAYMEKNPRYLDSPKIIGVIFALKESYACPSKN